MKGMGEIFKKEIVRVFKDPKMVLSIFVLPVVLMIGLLYLMGNVMTNMQDDIASHKSPSGCIDDWLAISDGKCDDQYAG